MTSKLTIRQISTSAMVAALLSIMAQISIPLPMTPIPITLQTAGLIIVLFLSDKKAGVVGVLAYLLLGAVGVPVFNGGKSGIGILFGPTGGFLLSFIPALLMAFFIRKTLFRLSQNKVFSAYAAVFVMTMVILLAGVLWFMLITENSFLESASACCLPFLPGDIGKLLIFTPLGLAMEVRLNRALGHAHG